MKTIGSPLTPSKPARLRARNPHSAHIDTSQEINDGCPTKGRAKARRNRSLSNRDKGSLERLLREQIIHKEHRMGLVRQKLMMTSIFVGITPLQLAQPELHILLYATPLFALVLDAYILAEDYKVKRVGRFLHELPQCSEVDRKWELEFMPMHREKLASAASMTFTILITAMSLGLAYLLDVKDPGSKHFTLFLFGTGLSLGMIILLFVLGRSIRWRRIVTVEKMRNEGDE